MKKTRLCAIFLMLCLLLSVLASCGDDQPEDGTKEISGTESAAPAPVYEGTVIRIGTDGDDAADGKNAPVATLARALEIAKDEITKDDVTIVFGDGDFYITEPVTLSQKMTDGEHGHTLRISGSGKSTLNGGVPVTGWEKTDKENIYRAKVSPEEVSGFFADGESKTPASQKITGSFRKGGAPGIIMNNSESYASWADYDQFSKITELYFTAKGGNLPDPAELSDAWLYMDQTFHRVRFDFSSAEKTADSVVFRCDDETVTLCNSHAMASYNENMDRYMLVNSKAFLDEEGEYFFDRGEGMLYYCTEKDPNTSECFIPVSDTLLTVKGAKKKLASGIVIENMIFRYDTLSYLYDRPARQEQGSSFRSITRDEKDPVRLEQVPGLLNITFASNIVIDHCEFRNSGCGGITSGKNVYNMEVKNCLIYDTAANGITAGIIDPATGWGLGNDGDLPGDLYNVHEIVQGVSIIPMVLSVTNNHVEKIGTVWTGATAIEVMSAGDVVIEHNTIKDVADTGINAGNGLGNYTYKSNVTPHMRNFTVRYNHISRVGLMNEDCGAIYTQSYFLGDGCRISDNYIDLEGAINAVVSALYTDGGSENVTMTNNAIKYARRWLWCRVLPCEWSVDHYRSTGVVDGSSIINCSITGNYTEYKNNASGWDDASTAKGANVTIADNKVLSDFDTDPTVKAIREAAGTNAPYGVIVY